ATLMAFTSEFLPTTVYTILYNKGLEGYKNFTLNFAPPNTTSEPCRYNGGFSQHQHSEFYWKLMAARIILTLSFQVKSCCFFDVWNFCVFKARPNTWMLISKPFQQVVFAVSRLVSWAIPDVPSQVENRNQRQKYLARKSLIDRDILGRRFKRSFRCYRGADAVLIIPGHPPQRLLAPAGSCTSSFRAEECALRLGFQAALDILPWPGSGELRCATDSQDIWALLRRVPPDHHITIQWVPGHCDLRLNDLADSTARDVARLPQADAPLDLRSTRSAIAMLTVSNLNQAYVNDQHCTTHRSATQGRPPKRLPLGFGRKAQVTLAQLRTSHSPRLRKYRHRIGLETSATCPACDPKSMSASGYGYCTASEKGEPWRNRQESSAQPSSLQRTPRLSSKPRSVNSSSYLSFLRHHSNQENTLRLRNRRKPYHHISQRNCLGNRVNSPHSAICTTSNIRKATRDIPFDSAAAFGYCNFNSVIATTTSHISAATEKVSFDPHSRHKLLHLSKQFTPTKKSPQAVSPQQQAIFSSTRQLPQAKLVPQPTNAAPTQQPTISVPTKQPTNAASKPKPPSEATNDSEPPPRESIKTCFFRDGIRRVDYVLVWEEDLRDTEDYFSKKAAMHRKKFEDNLIEVGVEIERETCISSKKKIHFVKLFVSWTTMCYYAEYLGFRRLWSRSRSSELFSSPLEAKSMSKQKQFYTCAFSADKATKYIGISNKDTYFRPTQRFEVAFELLGTQIYGKKDQSEVGLDSMIRRGIYSCAYPPHEGSSSTPAGLRPEQMNARQLLHNYWGRWKLWYKFQPLDHIRDYFGEKIAFYFAFIAYGFLKFWKRKTARLAYQWDVLDYVEMEERPRPEYASRCTEYEEDPITGNMEPHFPSSKRRLRILIGVLSLMVMMILSTASLIAMLMTRSSILHALFNNKLVRSRAVTLANASSACVNLIIVLALELIYEKIAFNITEWEMHRTQTQFENQVIFKVFVFEIFNHYLSISYIAFIKGNVVGEPGKYNELFGSRLADCINGSCMFELTQLMAIILIGKQVAVQIIEMLIPKLLTFLHIGSTGLQANQLPNASQSWDADYMLIPYDTGLFMDYLELIMQFGFVTLFVPAFPLAPLFALINNLVEIRLDARKLVIGTRRPLPERAQSIGIWFSMMKFVAHVAVISNGSLMAFTSESLAISVFRPVYGGDLGFKNYTLSWAQANTTSEPCRFNMIPNNTEYYWKLQAIRIVYMLFFQQVVTLLTSVMNWFIPNIPEDLKRKIKRQKYLAKKALMDREMIGRRHKRAAFVA
uniref:Anoctamin n=1 Tax=Macrostomum lignano TaxID=282301 RepID=A0A1I8JHA4_9PLAT